MNQTRLAFGLPPSTTYKLTEDAHERSKATLLWVGLVLTSGVMAAPVPPITGSSLIEMPQALTASEQAGLDIAKRWINGTDKPIRSPMGRSLTFWSIPTKRGVRRSNL